MRPGLLWNWRSDTSHMNVAMFGAAACGFQLYLEVRFVISTKVERSSASGLSKAADGKHLWVKGTLPKFLAGAGFFLRGVGQ